MAENAQRAVRIHSVIDLMIRTMRLHHRNIERVGSETGLHRSQRMLLMHLSKSETAPSQKEIAEHFDISPACVARTLKALAAEGYITRSGDDDDQRRNNVRITEKGVRSVTETRRAFDEFDQTIFSDFSDEEIAQLTALLSRVQHNLRCAEEQFNEKSINVKGSAST